MCSTSTQTDDVASVSDPGVSAQHAPQPQRPTAVQFSGDSAWTQVPIATTQPREQMPSSTTAPRVDRKRRRANSNKTAPENNKGKWTEEEDQLLRLLVSQYGAVHNWTCISRAMTFRNTKQCRERWCKHLDNKLKHGNWTDEEDTIILRLRQEGKGWAAIARHLEGRTDNTVKIRWNSLVRSQRRLAKRAAKEAQMRLLKQKKIRKTKTKTSKRTRGTGNKNDGKPDNNSLAVGKSITVACDPKAAVTIPSKRMRLSESNSEPNGVVERVPMDVLKQEFETKLSTSVEGNTSPRTPRQQVQMERSPKDAKPTVELQQISPTYSGKNKGKWLPFEDKLLTALVETFGQKWSVICRSIAGRNIKQCRERWCKHLDPSLRHGDWSPEEDQIILTGRMNRKGWAEIARQLQGRTDNKVKIRWNSLIRTHERKERHRRHFGH